MPPASERQLDRVFHALANPTRRRLLSLFSRRAMTVAELAAPFDMSLAAVSKHLQVLEEAGLLTRTARGRSKSCALNAGALRVADEWLAHYRIFWEGRLDGLAQYLLSAPPTRAARKKRPGKR